MGMGAEIVLVISNKPGVEGLKRAERAAIPTEVPTNFLIQNSIIAACLDFSNLTFVFVLSLEIYNVQQFLRGRDIHKRLQA